MTDFFESLIHQLGIALHTPLHVDHKHACTLQIHQKIRVQLQMDSAQEHVIALAFISELPPGKFRENVLAEALKANNLPDPRVGILGYLLTKNTLTLHQSYPIRSLDGHSLALFVAGLTDYAALWRDAIEHGQSSPAPIFLTPPLQR